MNVTNAVLPIAAIVAGALAFDSGRETVVSLTTPPVIEGYGEYAEPVRAGEVALIHWRITKRTDCPGLTSRVWDGPGGFHLTETVQQTSLPKGTFDRKIETEIPTLAPAGELTLSIVGFFQCEGDGKTPFRLGPVNLTVVP